MDSSDQSLPSISSRKRNTMLDARGEELSRLKSIRWRLNYIHALRTLHFTPLYVQLNRTNRRNSLAKNFFHCRTHTLHSIQFHFFCRTQDPVYCAQFDIEFSAEFTIYFIWLQPNKHNLLGPFEQIAFLLFMFYECSESTTWAQYDIL